MDLFSNRRVEIAADWNFFARCGQILHIENVKNAFLEAMRLSVRHCAE